MQTPSLPVPTKVGLGQQTALTTIAEVERRCDYARLPFLLLELQCQAGCVVHACNPSTLRAGQEN